MVFSLLSLSLSSFLLAAVQTQGWEVEWPYWTVMRSLTEVIVDLRVMG